MSMIEPILQSASAAAIAFVAAAAISSGALGQINIPSDGSDGVFNPTASVVIDLSAAATGHWSTPGDGNGVYDPEQWAVVFKFSEVNIPSGVTVTFAHHPSFAPVMWLVQGDVVISGTVSLNGSDGLVNTFPRRESPGGPGGFRGGRGSASLQSGSGGHGPGGGGSGVNAGGTGGSYATLGSLGGVGSGGTAGTRAVYGNAGVFPLIGGSGGAGGAGTGGHDGAGGGGAILIASQTSLQIAGAIRANGGSGPQLTQSNVTMGGGGAGGGVRLIADAISGSGVVEARGGLRGFSSSSFGTLQGGSGGAGRVRLEANTVALTVATNPESSVGLPGDTPRLFRDPSTPSIRAVSIGGVPVPTDTNPRFFFPPDVIVEQAGIAVVVIEAESVPPDSVVTVRVTRRVGQTSVVTATYVSGDLSSSLWEVEIDLGNGFSGLQVRAQLPESPG